MLTSRVVEKYKTLRLSRNIKTSSNSRFRMVMRRIKDRLRMM
jgi:hypothetical protein